MTADIFGARFYGYRQPAWHRLGQVSRDRIGAVEAFRRLGPYDVVLEPRGSGSAEIIRPPTSDDAVSRSFGEVGPEYVLISPDELTTLWDTSAGQPVETMGALQRGRCLFLTMRLRPFEVRGDAVTTYLVLAHWMSSARVSTAFVSPVRVVCSNTLAVAQRLARARVDLAPTPGLRERIGAHVQRLVRDSALQSVLIRGQLTRLAGRTVTRAEAESVVAAAYPGDAGSLRQAALDLFDGAGTGMDLPATRGTLWGLYNAIAELENFREGGTDVQAATDVLFGSRAKVMQAAFEAALTVCRGGGLPPAVLGSPMRRQLEPVLTW